MSDTAAAPASSPANEAMSAWCARSSSADGLAGLLDTLAALSADVPLLAGASRRERLAQLDVLLASLISSAAARDALDWESILRVLPSLAPDAARRLLPALAAVGPPTSALPRLHAAAISALSHRGHDSWLRAAAGALRACGAAVMHTRRPDGEAAAGASASSRAPASGSQRLDASTIAALLDTALGALARGGATTVAAAAPTPQSAAQAERMGFQGGALAFGRRDVSRTVTASGLGAGAVTPATRRPPRSTSALGRGPAPHGGSSPTKPRTRQATDDEAGWTSAASQSGNDDQDPMR